MVVFYQCLKMMDKIKAYDSYNLETVENCEYIITSGSLVLQISSGLKWR